MDLHYVLRENKAWSCVSIFYSRKDWTTLLLEIVSFYQYNEKIFNCFQVNFSEKRGEHIRITFSSDVENMKMIQMRMNVKFLSFLENRPSCFPKEFPFGKEIWSYYPNNTLVWNQYEIRYPITDLMQDEQIKACLLSFFSSEYEKEKCLMEKRAFELLVHIQQNVADAPSGMGLAKWGCLVECLVQNSLIEADLDDLLAETDEFLISLWEETNHPFSMYEILLWVADYFLYRLWNKCSKCHDRSLHMVEQIVLCFEQLFYRRENFESIDPIFLFSIDFWYDLKWWLMHIDNVFVAGKAKKVLEKIALETDVKVELKKEKNILNIYEIQEQLEKANNRKIWLKCGGFITIDKTEALTAIDVNSGKYVGTKDLEKTIFTVNKEATIEITKQIRLRDIGGIIIIDYIDMENKEDKAKILEILEENLKKDRSKTQVIGFTPLDLLEMTRKHMWSND